MSCAHRYRISYPSIHPSHPTRIHYLNQSAYHHYHCPTPFDHPLILLFYSHKIIPLAFYDVAFLVLHATKVVA